MSSLSESTSLGTLVRGVSCDLNVTGSSRGIGHWKQVRPPTIHPLGCSPSPDLAYVGCFMHTVALTLSESTTISSSTSIYFDWFFARIF